MTQNGDYFSDATVWQSHTDLLDNQSLSEWRKCTYLSCTYTTLACNNQSRSIPWFWFMYTEVVCICKIYILKQDGNPCPLNTLWILCTSKVYDSWDLCMHGQNAWKGLRGECIVRLQQFRERILRIIYTHIITQYPDSNAEHFPRCALNMHQGD